MEGTSSYWDLRVEKEQAKKVKRVERYEVVKGVVCMWKLGHWH